MQHTLTGRVTTEFAAKFSALIDSRERDMRALLDESAHMPEAIAAAVTDFKEIAAHDSEAVLDNAQAAHALEELGQLALARRRIAAHSYGFCLECGDAIDLQRLVALPATRYCIACQSVLERAIQTAAQR